jgi:glucose/arabinose dehydrogenase
MKLIDIFPKAILLSYVLVFSEACSQPKVDPPPAYRVVVAFPNLSFDRPVDFQHSNDNTNRIFVVEQKGEIFVFKNESATSNKKAFLDIRNKVDDDGNEEGLLGLAFHPAYKTNGYFYLNYTASNPNRTVISRFKVSSNSEEADPSSEVVLLEFPQPYSNHNGGQIAFGPDGYLYIATGDGGSGGDPKGNGQNRSTLLGKILRIDVDHEQGGKRYAIPADNPFATSTEHAKEIFAYGLRNPWRFSFDATTKKLWAGDVGQGSREEIDIIENGKNYGWNTMEGRDCFEPSNGCKTQGLTLPVWQYGRNDGNSITGGFVYRGQRLSELKGKYIYADFGSGNIWSLDSTGSSNPANTKLLRSDLQISSFGVDEKNELYMCAFDGKIYRLEK